MKHRIKAKHFNRDTKSRKALLKNLLRDLFTHGHITTSEGRVKEIARLADKLIAKAKAGTLTARRDLHEVFGRRDVVNALVDKIAPVFTAKKSGFSTIEKIAARRGDGTILYKLSLLIGDLKLTTLKKERVVAEKTTEVKKEVAAKPVAAKKVAVKKPAAKKAVAKKPTAKKPAAKAKKSEETK
jgi:large subunit ribosomal protein L17